MRFTAQVVSQTSGAIHVVQFDHSACPDGFAVDERGALEWYDLPPQLAETVGTVRLTNARLTADHKSVEFVETQHGQHVRVSISAYRVLGQAVEWWLSYDRAAVIARDLFWDAEIGSSYNHRCRDFGEQFL